jgi:hypothetical protein
LPSIEIPLVESSSVIETRALESCVVYYCVQQDVKNY